MTVRAGLFGPLSVATTGGRLGPRDLGGVKPRQLFEMLLLERGHTVTKDSLADQLWGDDLPLSVAATIETYVSLLRSRVGREVIVTATGGYAVDPGRVEVDLDEFDRLFQLGVSGEAADRYPHLVAAARLGAEPVLADEPYADWVLPTRRKYRDRHHLALVELAECCIALGRHQEAATWAAAAVEADGTDERAARALMLSEYALGDRPRALAAYADLRRSLAADFGVVPTVETSQLYSAIREQAGLEMLLDGLPGRAPAIRFAAAASTRIAYQSFGRGPMNMVFMPPFLTNLAATWDEPVYASFLHRLGSLARVTLFDKRGTGLSDPVFGVPSEAERTDDIRAILDAEGIDRAVLFGACDGGATCIRFAARHPERVAALILFAVPACLLASPDFEWGWSRRFYESFLGAFDSAWTTGAGLEAMDPSIVHDPRYRALFSRFLRLGASPGLARRLWEIDGPALDVRSLLAEVAAPALVMVRTGDQWVAPANSAYLAGHLRSGHLVELEGSDHEPWLGDPDPVIEAASEFLCQLDRQSSGMAARPTGFQKDGTPSSGHRILPGGVRRGSERETAGG